MPSLVSAVESLPRGQPVKNRILDRLSKLPIERINTLRGDPLPASTALKPVAAATLAAEPRQLHVAKA
jgi:hypothetical protein